MGLVGAARDRPLTLSGRKWGWVGAQSATSSRPARLPGPARETEALQAHDADVVRWATQDASALLGRDLHPVDHTVVRWVDGLPQYAVGHLDPSPGCAPRSRPPGPGGVRSVLDGVGVPACIAAARRAAAEVA